MIRGMVVVVQMDKASVLSDAVMYLKELKQKIAELEAQVEQEQRPVEVMARSSGGTQAQVGEGLLRIGNQGVGESQC